MYYYCKKKKKNLRTFSKRLRSSTNLEILAEQIIRARPTRMVSKYYPQHRVWNCNFGDCLDIVFVVYHRLSVRLVNTNQTHLVRTFFTKIIKQGELSGILWPLLIPEYSGIKMRGTPFLGLRNPGISCVTFSLWR